MTATGLGFAYQSSSAILDGLDLSVPAGSSAAVMAPSGVGKTTLLMVLGGLRRAQAGEVVIVDETSDDTARSGRPRPRVAWVFQAMHLIGGRTAVDNVAIAVLSGGMPRPRAEALARHALERFGVGELADRPVRSLSGGQCQRVALARAAVAEPLVVLADEPTANLDQDNAAAVAQVLVRGFPRSAVLIATHDATVARQTDRVWYLDHGRLRPVTLDGVDDAVA
ncbi:MAG: ATP-binding cassette domain-containing protein [Bifidobacteriaceae bacterium]|jgi:ABC-type lipoprotein export system ATPase subunit|nr:ATP-binding cassette domain-containing protein [Bifidobacteriaceae bacterium]